MITDADAVLVLGAGTSAPFNIPLGGQLIDEIRTAILAQKSKVFRDTDFGGHTARSILVDAATNRNHQVPIYAAVAHRHWNFEKRDFHTEGLNKDLSRLEQLARLLENQTAETIDDFIVENPSYADLTKICIATSIIGRCYERHDSEIDLRAFDARNAPNGERNWVHLLINLIRHGVRRGTVHEGNKVRIISFNYDSILEHVLGRQFSNSEAKHPNYRTFVEIVHAHGVFPPLAGRADGPIDFPKLARESAQQIHVVNERDVPEDAKAAHGVAQRWIQEARIVYAAGFAFAGPNCELLGLPEWCGVYKTRHLRYCNFAGEIGLRRTVERMIGGNVNVLIEEANGSKAEGLSVSAWIGSGHLGQMPG